MSTTDVTDSRIEPTEEPDAQAHTGSE